MEPIAELAAIRLKKRSAECKTVDQMVDLAFSFGIGPLRIKPLQIRSEISKLVAILIQVRPRTVCEIGTAHGGTLFLISRVSAVDATITSIDLPKGTFGGGYDPWKIPYYKSFAGGQQRLHLIRGSSQDQEVITRVCEIVGKHGIEFLLIDGDHEYDAVRKDFETYSPYVKDGIIALHDICASNEPNVGVPRLWQGLKAEFSCLELIEDQRQGWAGIGVILRGKMSPYREQLIRWINN